MNEMGFGFTLVTERTFVGRSERPFLLVDIPFGPGIERHEIGAAILAHIGRALAGLCHAASLPLPNTKSK